MSLRILIKYMGFTENFRGLDRVHEHTRDAEATDNPLFIHSVFHETSCLSC